MQETQGSCQVSAGDSELLYCFGGTSEFLSSCSMGHRVPLEPWRGTWGSSRVGGSVQGSSRVPMGPPVDFSWGISFLAVMCRVGSVLLQCMGAYSLVLAWVFTTEMVRVNFVAVCSILSSCGVQAPLSWWREVHLY